MTTINIGPYSATVTDSGNSFNGTLQPIVYGVGGVEFVRISSDTDSNQGAHIQGTYDPWAATINGKVSVLNGEYSQSAFGKASLTSFDVPLPKQTLIPAVLTGGIKLEIYGRVKLDGSAFSLTISPVLSIPISYMGISLNLKCIYTEVTTVDVGTVALGKSFSIAASVFGVKVGSPSVTIAVDASTVEGIATKVYSALIDQVEKAIYDYLLAWAEELAELSTAVASYIVDFGSQIVDTFESLFTSGGSSGPPPPFLINTFAGSAQLGSTALIQFGQALSTSDDPQPFMFPEAFAGISPVVLLNAARPNIWSALSVSSRASNNFAINRDNAIDYHVPFHWIALGPAEGSTMNENGFTDVGDVRIQWGQGISTSDGDQTFNMTSGFGSGPVAVVVNTDSAGIRSALALGSIDAAAGRFVVNRDDAVDGNVKFTYLAIGPIPGRTITEGVLRYEGLTIQWGQANSSSDGEQLVPLPASFASMNFSVVTSFVQANVQSALSLSRAIHEACFIVNRDGRIDGVVPFNWIAVGW